MATNKNIVLIMGPPSSGKSTSLMQLTNQSEMVYLNTDLKELPFKDNFLSNVEVADAMDVLSYIPQIEENPAVNGVVLDTVTFLMNMYERQYVSTAVNTQQAWGSYANFYREFIHAIKAGSKNYAILAHEETSLNEKNMQMETKVPVKGAVGRIGVEADFTTILSAKQMPISKVEQFVCPENKLLTISDDEREDGFKYVFQTRCIGDSMGEKMRSAMGLWHRKELYINNDLNAVFARLNEYYA